MYKEAIGLIGGSFDPIHKGHLHFASLAQAYYQLKAIHFIPCHQNPLKSNPPYASAEDRIKMLELAVSPFKQFFIDLREISKKTPSYTIDTLQAIRNEQPNTPLVFLMAFDAFTYFTQWQDWENILNYAHLIIANRAGYSHNSLSPELSLLLSKKKKEDIASLHESLAGHIFIKNLTPTLSISSTLIRQRIANQQDIDEWVPVNVKDYIFSHQLYI